MDRKIELLWVVSLLYCSESMFGNFKDELFQRLRVHLDILFLAGPGEVSFLVFLVKQLYPQRETAKRKISSMIQFTDSDLALNLPAAQPTDPP